ncbi:MAG: DEAD/DEAH box helicase family protein [Thaumarchaeota archaeon]|nr:DEAD/DEAH box helicase family protein [Nitrososphaerota archaeon]
MTPEAQARKTIDHRLEESGWTVQDHKSIDLSAGFGVAVREFPLGKESADYALFIDRNPVGVVEAKPEGWTLTGVTVQSDGYLEGLARTYLSSPRRPPFSYESTGIETLFTDRRDPRHRSRHVFTFHRPEVLADFLKEDTTLRGRLGRIPPLDYDNLRKCQTAAIMNLERSFADGRQRALIQMATGTGKTFTAVTFIYRLIKFAKARKVLFLVDRANLGRQALREFQQYTAPDDGRKFTDLYNVQHLQSQTIDDVSVVISTVQRLYSILQGKNEFAEDDDEFSNFEGVEDDKQVDIQYNPNIPIGEFDFIVIDECHRSIYNKWKQVLDYFDSFLIGLTATPSKHTIGFFENNQVMEYTHERAVADRVNVGYQVYAIRTKITSEGSTIEAGETIEKRDRLTREQRAEVLDHDYTYEGKHLDRDVLAPDQIRLVIKTFRDRLSGIFPGRNQVPKTLIFAKDDAHAEEITKITRNVFGEGNEFCQKITYKTTGAKPEDLIKSFRNSVNPRIAVTVDMIATGTDIRPLECIMFMRDVKSELYFDQMKGRGTRVIDPNDLQAVTPDARSKDHFVIVDAVGVCEHAKSDTHSLNRKKGISFERLMQMAAEGRADEDALKSLVYRMSILDGNLDEVGKNEIERTAGMTIPHMVNRILDGTDADKQHEYAREKFDTEEPTPEQLADARKESIRNAGSLFDSPKLRNALLDAKKKNELVIDNISTDTLQEAGFDERAREMSQNTVASFREFLEKNKDELAALRIIYSKPYNIRDITFKDIKELADAISIPPYNLTPGRIWDAYRNLERARVRNNPRKMLTDLISIVRFSTGQADRLAPFDELVDEKFAKWIETQESSGRRFTGEQLEWLTKIKEHIGSSVSITLDDLDYVPFNQMGGRVRFYQVFGDTYEKVLEELHAVLVE